MLTQILKETAEILRDRGIEVATGAGDVVAESRLAQLESLHGFQLPEELRRIYLFEGDGLHLSWRHEKVSGVFDIPPAAELIESTKRFRSYVADFAGDPKSMDRCIQPAYRSRAFEIWDSMRLWTLFSDEGNGDGFCMRPDGAVVYNQHDWFDGFGELATTNGLVAGTSLLDYTRSWSRFFFTSPVSLWWGEFGKRGRIDWEPSLFHPAFTQP